MKKIIFIHLFNDRSGSPKVLSQVIKTFRKSGYETEVLTSCHKNGFLTDIADTNRTLFYKRSENKLLTLLYYIISQTLLFFQCLRYKNQDVIFYVNTMMPFGAALSGKFIGKKVIYHIHETSLRPKILKKFLRLIIAITAEKIIFVSKYLKETEFFENKKQTVIYNSHESNDIVNETKEKDDFIVLMICSLKVYKGILEFIQIAKLLNTAKFNLVLNATQNEINKYFPNTKTIYNLTVYSRQDDLTKFYQKSSILLNLSRPDEVQETFGLTIIEGMEYGLPSIVPPIGGPTEIVRENIDGYQISCYETETIINKIKYLMNNNDEYKRIAHNAKKRVKKFDIKEFKKKIVNIVEDI